MSQELTDTVSLDVSKFEYKSKSLFALLSLSPSGVITCIMRSLFLIYLQIPTLYHGHGYNSNIFPLDSSSSSISFLWHTLYFLYIYTSFVMH